MAKGGGIGGKGGISGAAKIGRSIGRSVTKGSGGRGGSTGRNNRNDSNGRGRPRRPGRRNEFAEGDDNSVFEASNRLGLFDEGLDINVPSLRLPKGASNRLKAVGRNLKRRLADKIKLKGRKFRKEDVLEERRRAEVELRKEACNQSERDLDMLSTRQPLLTEELEFTESGIFNGLENGQRGLIDVYGRDAFMSTIRGGGNGRQAYRAAMESHDAMEEAVGQTFLDLADSFDRMMDIGQTIINESSDFGDNN